MSEVIIDGLPPIFVVPEALQTTTRNAEGKTLTLRARCSLRGVAAEPFSQPPLFH
jgi:hypothetical protein